MYTFRKEENIISRIDDVCTKILLALAKDTADAADYAKLQRTVGAGSVQTIKRHIEHLKQMGMVHVKTEKRGIRDFYKISLSKKGSEAAHSFDKKISMGKEDVNDF